MNDETFLTTCRLLVIATLSMTVCGSATMLIVAIHQAVRLVEYWGLMGGGGC